MAKANEGDKASLVQCRIEAVQKIDEIVESEDVSIRKAMKMLAGASGVPFDTLRYWYYRDDESSISGGKTPPTQDPKKTVENKAAVAAKIVKNINKALDQDEEDAMSSSQGKAAKELADKLGNKVVKEELYELFLRKIAEVDSVIKANKELELPMDTDNLTIQLLRLARNAGWTEPVVEEPEKCDCNTCNKCFVTSCPNRACDNHVPKGKKKVKAKLPLRLPKKKKKVKVKGTLPRGLPKKAKKGGK
jgi:hypothetical protein